MIAALLAILSAPFPLALIALGAFIMWWASREERKGDTGPQAGAPDRQAPL